MKEPKVSANAATNAMRRTAGVGARRGGGREKLGVTTRNEHNTLRCDPSKRTAQVDERTDAEISSPSPGTLAAHVDIVLFPIAAD